MKLYIDPGHGGNDPGASGNGLVEKDIVLDIARNMRTILLNEYANVEVRMSRSDDRTVSLQQRTDDANAWGADYFVSIHCNAFNGSADGYEDYIHNALSDSSQTASYRNIMHEEITKANQLRNRGKKKANFHVLRETNMSAFLSENGFIDNSSDAELLRDPAWREQVARGHVNGIVRAFNLQPKEEENGEDTLFRVIAGSFQSRENAEQRVDFLTDQGIESSISVITVSGEQWFRVQAGAFSNRANAEQRLREVIDAGIEDAYISS